MWAITSSRGLILSDAWTVWLKVILRISNNNAIDLGKKQIILNEGGIVEYEGEILDGDKATGFGIYTDKHGTKFSGHFVDEMREGACESPTI